MFFTKKAVLSASDLQAIEFAKGIISCMFGTMNTDWVPVLMKSSNRNIQKNPFPENNVIVDAKIIYEETVVTLNIPLRMFKKEQQWELSRDMFYATYGDNVHRNIPIVLLREDNGTFSTPEMISYCNLSDFKGGLG